MKRLVVMLIAALLAACGQPSLHEQLMNDGCTLDSRVHTGRSIYCGKACWKAEIVATYSCPALKRSFVE